MTQPQPELAVRLHYTVSASAKEVIAVNPDVFAQLLVDFGVAEITDLPPDVIYDVVSGLSWGTVVLCAYCCQDLDIGESDYVHSFTINGVTFNRRGENLEWSRQ